MTNGADVKPDGFDYAIALQRLCEWTAARIRGEQRELPAVVLAAAPHHAQMLTEAFAAEQLRADALAPGAAFAGWALSELREEYLGCDLDGGDAQDAAVRYGLMEAVPVTAACGDDCRCADDDNIPGDCYRYTHAGKVAIVAHAFAPAPEPR